MDDLRDLVQTMEAIHFGSACRCPVCDSIHTPVVAVHQIPTGLRCPAYAHGGRAASQPLVGHMSDPRRRHRTESPCSRECQRVGEARRHRRRRAWDARSRPATDYTLTCKLCGTPFAARRWDAKYCGGRCRVRAHRATRPDEQVFSHDEQPAPQQ